MTQEELAERADLTAGFISQVERGKTSISIDSLLMILDALNIHISDFFRPMRSRVHFPRDVAVELGREGVASFRVLVPGAANRTMEPVRVRLKKGQHTRLEPFSGEQFGYVLEGQLRIAFGGHEDDVKAGDSFFADGTDEMIITNHQQRPAVFLWVTSPPYF
jgi:transcriptional regulator with XRE-family HTH domain